MKLQLLVVCLAFALTNLAALAQDNPSTVSASTASTTGVGSTDIGLYVNPIGIGHCGPILVALASDEPWAPRKALNGIC